MDLKELREKFKKENYYLEVFEGGDGLNKWNYSPEYVDWLEKQLLIHGVVSSLPSKEEMEIGLETLIAYKEDSFKTEYDKITFKFGFRTCFNWLSKRKTK